MKDYKIKAYGTTCLLLLTLAVSAVGCGTQQSAPTPAGDRVKVQQTNEANKKNIDNPKKVAAHLENLARSVVGVEDANCVVFNHYAIVGIDVDAQMDRSKVGTLKYAVAEAFRKDPYGINAVVTADMDLAQRLREIRVDINNGHPVAGFTEELGDIVGRLIPQIPRNIIPPKAPEDLGTNNSQR